MICSFPENFVLLQKSIVKPRATQARTRCLKSHVVIRITCFRIRLRGVSTRRPRRRQKQFSSDLRSEHIHFSKILRERPLVPNRSDTHSTVGEFSQDGRVCHSGAARQWVHRMSVSYWEDSVLMNVFNSHREYN